MSQTLSIAQSHPNPPPLQLPLSTPPLVLSTPPLLPLALWPLLFLFANCPSHPRHSTTIPQPHQGHPPLPHATQHPPCACMPACARAASVLLMPCCLPAHPSCSRLKPIYCDRLDAGILAASAPLTIEVSAPQVLAAAELAASLLALLRSLTHARAHAQRLAAPCSAARTRCRLTCAPAYVCLCLSAWRWRARERRQRETAGTALVNGNLGLGEWLT